MRTSQPPDLGSPSAAGWPFKILLQDICWRGNRAPAASRRAVWTWVNGISSWHYTASLLVFKTDPLEDVFTVCASFATVQFSPSCSPQFLSPWFLEASLTKLIRPPFDKFSPYFSAALMGPALSLTGNPFLFWHTLWGVLSHRGCSPSTPEAGESCLTGVLPIPSWGWGVLSHWGCSLYP